MKLSWVAALVLPAWTAYGADDGATYSAVYRVEYKGKEAGTAEFGVRALESGLYEFSSRTLAKGLLKLARPNPAVERSHFRVENGSVRPVEFWFEDGSRSGEDNLHI